LAVIHDVTVSASGPAGAAAARNRSRSVRMPATLPCAVTITEPVPASRIVRAAAASDVRSSQVTAGDDMRSPTSVRVAMGLSSCVFGLPSSWAPPGLL